MSTMSQWRQRICSHYVPTRLSNVTIVHSGSNVLSIQSKTIERALFLPNWPGVMLFGCRYVFFFYQFRGAAFADIVNIMELLICTEISMLLSNALTDSAKTTDIQKYIFFVTNLNIKNYQKMFLFQHSYSLSVYSFCLVWTYL